MRDSFTASITNKVFILSLLNWPTEELFWKKTLEVWVIFVRHINLLVIFQRPCNQPQRNCTQIKGKHSRARIPTNIKIWIIRGSDFGSLVSYTKQCFIQYKNHTKIIIVSDHEKSHKMTTNRQAILTVTGRAKRAWVQICHYRSFIHVSLFQRPRLHYKIVDYLLYRN